MSQTNVVEMSQVEVEQTQTLEPKEMFRSTRTKMGMNQSEFAKMLGVSQGLVSLIEAGRTPVSKKISLKLTEMEKVSSPAEQNPAA